MRQPIPEHTRGRLTPLHDTKITVFARRPGDGPPGISALCTFADLGRRYPYNRPPNKESRTRSRPGRRAPFGFALFYLRGVTPPEVRTSDIYKGVIPFILIQLLMLGILALFPQLATWLPRHLYG